MGLPSINIRFESLGISAIQRSQKGIVALILKTNVGSEAKSFTFKSLNEVLESDFTTDNYDYLRLIFKGKPNRVIVEVGTVQECLQRLKSKSFNYLTVPGITSTGEVKENEIISSWIDSQRQNNKMVKAVLPKYVADNEAIINFDTSDINVDGKVYTTEQYCTRIAGILAGLPFTRSSTYFVLDEVTSITESLTPDEDIEAGKLILTNDGRKIKIARGVNSLTTTTKGKTEEFKKIKIVETMDLITEDIAHTFEDDYVGKINNSYDNKCILVTAINGYLKQLQKDEVLDSSNDAYVEVDVDANGLFIEQKGIDISTLTESQIKFYNTGSKVFLKGTVKPLDSMEDLDLIINI